MRKRFSTSPAGEPSSIQLDNFQMENKWQMARLALASSSTRRSGSRAKRANGKWKISPRGFTLVELILVVAIIGILSSVIMVNLLDVRQRGRDTKRKYDLSQIQSALELYRSDNGTYPVGGSFDSCNQPFAYSGKTYIQKIPCDPSTKAKYEYLPGITTYDLVACLENLKDPNLDTPGDCRYTVRNP